MKNDGFTLPELAAAIIIFSLLTLVCANITRYTVTAARINEAKQEALYTAQLALNFTKTQVEYANGYKVSYWSGDTLRYLDLYTALNPDDYEHNYVLSYNPGTKRLEFGGYGAGLGLNELASRIEDMTVVVDADKEMMYITVTAIYENESAALGGAVSLNGKELR